MRGFHIVRGGSGGGGEGVRAAGLVCFIPGAGEGHLFMPGLYVRFFAVTVSIPGVQT